VELVEKVEREVQILVGQRIVRFLRCGGPNLVGLADK
jgi:hypothetical protein